MKEAAGLDAQSGAEVTNGGSVVASEAKEMGRRGEESPAGAPRVGHLTFIHQLLNQLHVNHRFL